MANKQGTNQIVDAFIGDKLIEARYIGQTKYFDPYTTLTGNLPLSFNARVAGALKNYRLYGDSDGAGVQTENLWDGELLKGYWNNAEMTSRSDPQSNVFRSLKITLEAGTYTICFDHTIRIVRAIVNGTMSFLGEETAFYTITTQGGNVGFTFREIDSSSSPWRNSTIMIVQGSTAPTTYIPYGYKIPILNTSGVTENILSMEPDAWEQGAILNGGELSYSTKRIRQKAQIEIEPSTTYCVEVFGDIVPAWHLWEADGTTYISDSGWQTSTSPIIFTTPANAGYIRFTARKLDANASFSLSDLDGTRLIMLTKGSTAPDHYIPHRYTSNYDLMIGSTKLGAEEYLDYQEQKVYKRTENDFPFAKKGTFTFGNDGYIISNGEGKFFAAIPTSVSSTVNSVLIPLNETYTIPQSLDTGGEFIFYLGNNVTKAGLLLVLYDANGVQIENWAFTSKWRISTAYNQMAGKTIAYIGLRAISNSEQGNIELTPMFSKNDNLTTYIPYLQPTYPPVPLPAIQAYQGENTLSSTETVGEVSVKGRIYPMYRQVEYLKSTGTQVIATDIMPKNTYKYETKIKISSGSGVSNGCRMPFGVYETSNNVATGTTCLTISNPYSDRNVYYRLGTDSSTTYHFGSTLDDTAIEYTLARPNCKFNATDIAVSYPINLSEPTVPLAVFGVNRKADNNVDLWPYNFTSDCVIYYFKIYDSNSNLIYDLIPVERYDGVLGLYDKITAKFYMNTGTGEFVKGDYVDQTT